MTQMSLLGAPIVLGDSLLRRNICRRYRRAAGCRTSYGDVAALIGSGGLTARDPCAHRFIRARTGSGWATVDPRLSCAVRGRRPLFSKPRVPSQPSGQCGAEWRERELGRATHAWGSEIAASGAKEPNGFGGIAGEIARWTANFARRQVVHVPPQRVVAQEVTPPAHGQVLQHPCRHGLRIATLAGLAAPSLISSLVFSVPGLQCPPFARSAPSGTNIKRCWGLS